MIFESKVKFLNMEEKVSKKGNKYNVVTIMQNSDVLSMMSDVEVKLDFGRDFVAILDYNVQFKNIRIIGVK